MPGRDGKGPQPRSPRPSVPRGGRKLGNCKPSSIKTNK